MRLNREVPAKLEEIINKALEKDRSLRYQSAAELRTDLQRLQRDTSTRSVALPTVNIRTRRAWFTALAVAAPHGRWPLTLAAVFALLLVAGTLVWFRRLQPSPAPEMKLHQLTANSSENPVGTGAISPDGKYFAYTDLQGIHSEGGRSGPGKQMQASENLVRPVATRSVSAIRLARVLIIESRPPQETSPNRDQFQKLYFNPN